MEEQQFRTGCPTIDELLNGGFRRGQLVQIYGESGAGKTNIVAATAVHSSANGADAIVISEDDTTFDRILSFSESHPDAHADDITRGMLFRSVDSFAEQLEAIEQIREGFADSYDIVLVDGIGRYYRVERSKGKHGTEKLERHFTRQVTILRALARKYNLAGVITNQVYYHPDDGEVKPLGGAGMENWFDGMLQVQSVDDKHNIYVDQHRDLPSGGRAWFKITQSGLMPLTR